MIKCQIQLESHLDFPWGEWFGAVHIAHQADGTTCLSASLPDQSALIGLLLRVHDLGLMIITLECQAEK